MWWNNCSSKTISSEQSNIQSWKKSWNLKVQKTIQKLLSHHRDFERTKQKLKWSSNSPTADIFWRKVNILGKIEYIKSNCFEQKSFQVKSWKTLLMSNFEVPMWHILKNSGSIVIFRPFSSIKF
jgi:hypothetical protein